MRSSLLESQEMITSSLKGRILLPCLEMSDHLVLLQINQKQKRGMKSQNLMRNSERYSFVKDFVPLICDSEDGSYLSDFRQRWK